MKEDWSDKAIALCEKKDERIATLEANNAFLTKVHKTRCEEVAALEAELAEYKLREPELLSAEEVCDRLRKLKDGYVPIEET